MLQQDSEIHQKFKAEESKSIKDLKDKVSSQQIKQQMQGRTEKSPHEAAAM